MTQIITKVMMDASARKCELAMAGASAADEDAPLKYVATYGGDAKLGKQYKEFYTRGRCVYMTAASRFRRVFYHLIPVGLADDLTKLNEVVKAVIAKERRTAAVCTRSAHRRPSL